MRHVLKKLSVISFIGLSHLLWSQPIVSIEELRREGEMGNFFTTAINLSGSSGNEERENINNERVSINFNVSRTEDTDPPMLASESDTTYATEFRLAL